MTGINKTNLECVMGRDFIFTFSGTKNGAAVTWNTGSYVIRFIAKWQHEDADASAVISVSTGSGISATSSLVTVTIPASAFSSLAYQNHELKYELTLYDGSKSHTLQYGDLMVLPNVVRTAS